MVLPTSSVLRTLETRGLVTRTPDPADARVKRLAVTDEGRRRAVDAVAVVEAVDADFFSRAPDPALVLDILRQLAGIPSEESS